MTTYSGVMSNVNRYGSWWEHPITKEILSAKYFTEEENKIYKEKGINEAFQVFVQRIIKTVDRPELKEFLTESIVNGDFIPAGRVLAGAGTDKKMSMSNCYILPSPKDNLESIFDVASKMARIFSRGGGAGLNLSNLRPKGSKLNNAARTSTGAISFMDVYNQVGETIAQNGRRGATMIALNCNHPDIEEFLEIKKNNDKIQAANISICFDNKFMKAVVNNQDYELYFKVEDTGEEIRKTINAREFFYKFCESQYDWAEPAAIFIDTVRKNNLLSNYKDYKIDVSNPCAEFFGNEYNACLTGDTLVTTNNGVRQIKDLVNTQGYILTNAKYEKYHNVVNKGIKPVYKITLANGLTIKATNDHKFYLDNKWIELKDLKVNDKLMLTTNAHLMPINDYDDKYVMYGWLHGDGWFSSTIGISFNEKDGDYDAKGKLLPIFQEEFNAKDIKIIEPTHYKTKKSKVSCQLQVANSKAINHALELGFVPCKHRDKEFPTTFWNWNLKQQISFVRGLMSADGFVLNNSSLNIDDKAQFRQIAFASSSEKLIHQLQTFLSSLGLYSRKQTTIFNENINRKPQYKLVLAREHAARYFNIFGFCTERKNKKFNKTYGLNHSYKENKFVEIKSIEYVGEEEVYDIIEVNNTNAFYANGIYVHNCNLGSINLYNFVKEPFTPNAHLDFDRLCIVVQNAVKTMNDILYYGYNKQPLDENRKCIDDWKSIGLGVFGLADMLVALGIKYGSPESIKLVEAISFSMLRNALFASAKDTDQYGTFSQYDEDNTLKNKLINDVDKVVSLHELIKQYGLANGTLLSIAPTGSLSMLFREAGGVEPYYQVSYERTTHQLEKKDSNFKIKLNMLAVEHLLKANNLDITKITPEEIKAKFPYIVDTYDIEPKDRVDLQAALQKFVDNAISSTVNLKETATVQDIFDLYVYAWGKGCKGITIFRDNCKRINILGTNHGVKRNSEPVKLTMNKPIDKVVLNSVKPLKRGNNVQSLWGRTLLYHTACVPKFYVTVNIKDGEIFEVFVGADKGCQANISTITRLTSLALRSGVTVEEIIKNLNSAICPACTALRQKGEKNINKSCASCIADAIIEMQKTLSGGKNTASINTAPEIPNIPKKSTDIPIKAAMKCPECGEPTLIPDGKCAYCNNCGYSACN